MKKVLIAMSGGVDSSVAAALLKKQGYSCIGVFMHFWSEPQNNHLAFDFPSLLSMGEPSSPVARRAALMRDSGKSRSAQENKCCSVEAQEQARRVAQKIGIPLYTVNYKKPFKDIVVDYYIREYQAGRTPNPCVVCNQFIKFDLLLNEAKKQGCDYLATGHYARIVSVIKNQKSKIKSKIQNSKIKLFTAVDKDKDQTYFLYRLDREKLKKILFPIGRYKKTEVRKLAREFGLSTAGKKDSQGICFVAGTNENFLKKYLKIKPGPIVDVDGIEIGKHKGLLYYTIGQRHIGKSNIKYQKSKILKKSKEIPPLYVVSINIKSNALVIGQEKDLYKKELIAENVNWISGIEPKKGCFSKYAKIGARIRYRQPINKCQIKKMTGSKYKVVFDQSQRAITPGQSIVLYNKNQVLGGGIIA